MTGFHLAAAFCCFLAFCCFSGGIAAAWWAVADRTLVAVGWMVAASLACSGFILIGLHLW